MIKIIQELLNNKKIEPIVQFVKFGLVGVTNTILSYGIEMLFYYLLFVNVKFTGIVSTLNHFGIKANNYDVKVVIVSLVAFIVSVTNSYILNNRFVFASGTKTFGQHIASYIKTVLCYGITGLVLSPIIKVYFVDMGIPYYIAAFGSLIISIPLNFILNKFWAFRKKGKSDENSSC